MYALIDGFVIPCTASNHADKSSLRSTSVFGVCFVVPFKEGCLNIDGDAIPSYSSNWYTQFQNARKQMKPWRRAALLLRMFDSCIFGRAAFFRLDGLM